MNEKNEIKANGKHDAERRRFLRKSAVIAGATAVIPSIAMTKQNKTPKLPEKTRSNYDVQHQHIVDALNKYAAKSKRVNQAHIDAFAKGFIEQNGMQNYKQIFDGVHGEYKLVKLFMKSMNQSFIS